MNEHESIRGILALAAAGVLEPGDVRRVQKHADACAACRRDLNAWNVYAQGLRQLSAPAVPADLLERTQARILAERAAAGGRRSNDLWLCGLALFGWAASLAFWILARVLAGGILDVLGANLVNARTWFSISTVLVWVTAGAAAVMLGNRRARRRAL